MKHLELFKLIGKAMCLGSLDGLTQGEGVDKDEREQVLKELDEHHDEIVKYVDEIHKDMVATGQYDGSWVYRG